MSKKTIILCVALILALTLGLGGTLAYLTDTDADKNVMTVGRVQVVQNEQQRVEGEGEFTDELEPFENEKMVLPSTERDGTADEVTVGDNTLELTDKLNNYIDKIVSATNTGNTDAWVRTLVAVPNGGDAEGWLHLDKAPGYEEHWDLTEKVAEIEVDGINYDVLAFVHNEAVQPGVTTYPSLSGLYMDEYVDMDEDGYYIVQNGEEVRIANFLDSDGKLNVLVLTQAVQADGFADAVTAFEKAFPYGDDSANVQGWFTGWTAEDIGSPGDKWPDNNPPTADSAYVHNETELKAALSNPEVTNIMFGANIAVDEIIDVNGDVVIDMNGFNLDASKTEGRPFEIADGGSLTINAEDEEIKLGSYGLARVSADNDGVITLNGGNYTGAMDNGAFIKQVGSGDVTINLNDVKFSDNSDDSYILDVAQANVNVNGGEYTSPRGMQVLLGEVNISDAKITTTDNSTKNYAVVTYGEANIENSQIVSAYYAIATGNGGEINVKDSSVTSQNFYALYWFTSGGTYNLENTDLESNGPYNNADYYVNKVSAGKKAVLNIDGETVYQKGG